MLACLATKCASVAGVLRHFHLREAKSAMFLCLCPTKTNFFHLLSQGGTVTLHNQGEFEDRTESGVYARYHTFR